MDVIAPTLAPLPPKTPPDTTATPTRRVRRRPASALAFLQKVKRLQMLRSPEQLVDTLLICLEMQRELIARVEHLEAKLLRRRRR